MLLYDSVPVQFTYQNFGTSWAGILRGTEEDIDRVFNGLYNLHATNGRYDFHHHLNTVATFWTSEEGMRKFFYNQGRIELELKRVPAQEYAERKLTELKTENHEIFLDPKASYEVEWYSFGTISAEKPDTDLKDSIINHAYRNPEKACTDAYVKS